MGNETTTFGLTFQPWDAEIIDGLVLPSDFAVDISDAHLTPTTLNGAIILASILSAVGDFIGWGGQSAGWDHSLVASAW